MSEQERQTILTEFDPPFTVLHPAVQTTPFVFCSPHSGRVYPQHFVSRSRLDAQALRKSEDCFVDQLFAHVCELGAPLIAARFPRAYLDVNREPYELDPDLFGRPLPDWANAQSPRVVGGLGTIARIVSDGEEIYGAEGKPSLDDALARIELLYKPFHAALSGLVETTRARFGCCILVDCHSMPSMTNSYVAARPQFVLGDRFGTSCDGALVRYLRDSIGGLGYDVHLNRPYAGGYITEHYGRPLRDVHAVQLEINRGLYVDERTLTATAGYHALQRNLELLTRRLLERGPALLDRRAAAAE